MKYSHTEKKWPKTKLHEEWVEVTENVEFSMGDMKELYEVLKHHPYSIVDSALLNDIQDTLSKSNI